MTKRILMILTSHDDMGVSGRKTGNWFDEVATPYYTFLEHGFEVVMASPRGGAAPLDPMSEMPPYSTLATHRFKADTTAMSKLAQTSNLETVQLDAFDGAFFPGGYGQLWDLAHNSLAIRMIEQLIEARKPVAMVCHAPSILRDARKPNGEPLVAGRKVTGFTDAEDLELGLTPHLLFSVEQMLVANGGGFSASGTNWQPHVVEDGPLMTGQNPASAEGLAIAFANRLTPETETVRAGNASESNPATDALLAVGGGL